METERKCKRCGVTKPIGSFPKQGGGKWYSHTCHQCKDAAKATVKMVCQSCGKEFMATRHQVKRGYAKYCSQACASREKGKLTGQRDQYGVNNPNWKGGGTAHPSIYTRRFEKRYPEKHRAHVAVQMAVRNGTLKRGPCEECGQVENTHAHHDDYSKPLDVVWLCDKHHRIRHGATH